MKERSHDDAHVHPESDATAEPRIADKKRGRLLLAAILLAFFLRLLVASFMIGDHLNPIRDHWKFGWETGRLARSLASGRGFSSPLFGDTGPSAWMAPLYPLLLAGVFKLFGIYSTASAWVIVALNCAFGALTCLPLYYIARVSCGPRIAIISAWAWALFPYSIDFSGEMIWSTVLNALLLTAGLALTIALEGKANLVLWGAWGAFWGIVGLTEPSLLICLAVSGIWLVYRLRRNGLPGIYFWRPIFSALVFCLIVSPWFARNYRTFHQFMPFRDGFGLVMYEGNSSDTLVMFPDWTNPAHNDAELEQYTKLGEIAYMAQKKQQAITEISTHPGRFTLATIRRIIFTWTGYWDMSAAYRQIEPFALPNVFMATILTLLAGTGLISAFKRAARLAPLFAATLLFYPALYYISQTSMAYRHPIDPLLVLLGVLAFYARKAGEPQAVRPIVASNAVAVQT